MDYLKLFVLLLCFLQCQSANILYVIPFTGISHYIMLKPLGLELARRGHNVTVITAFKEKDPPANYHQVLIEEVKIWEALGDKRPNLFSMVDYSSEYLHYKILFVGGLFLTESALNSTEVQDLLKNDNKYDLVISEQFYQEAMYALAHKYETPLALITTFGNCMRHNIITRNPLQLSTVISEFIPIEDPSSFKGRFVNFYYAVLEYFAWNIWYMPRQEALAKKYIPGLKEPIPSLYDLQKNVSLMLLNSHFSFDVPAAYTPNMVEIGGMHLMETNSSLPEDIKNILDGAKHGVVYMSFGSNVRSSELPVEKRDAFLNVFRRLKQTVLWKWEDDQIEGQPNNIFIKKWLPQKEIFKHPNLKVFISHGGLIGTQEALFHGIPIIGVPIYADQYNNLLQAQNMGFGKVLKYKDITEEKFEMVLEEVLKDDTFKKNALEASKRFKDRPMSALDTAVYWIEYVIRNNGAKYMKNPGLELSWLAWSMLDVYAVVVVGLTVLFVVFIEVFAFLVKLVIKSKAKNSLKKNQ